MVNENANVTVTHVDGWPARFVPEKEPSCLIFHRNVGFKYYLAIKPIRTVDRRQVLQPLMHFAPKGNADTDVKRSSSYLFI